MNIRLRAILNQQQGKSMQGAACGSLVSTALFLVLTACTELPRPMLPDSADTGLARHEIFIVSHGWHTGVIVPAQPLLELAPGLGQRFAGAKFLEIGWGDQGFYQAEDINIVLVMQAIFWPTPSVVHVVALSDEPEREFAASRYKTVCISEAGMKSLLQYLLSGFASDAAGQWSSPGQGIYGDSQFYHGVGQYHAFNTCNTWTAKALQSAGLPVSARFTLTSDSVMDSLDDLPEAFSCQAEVP